jgi:anti-sigma factor RsiW
MHRIVQDQLEETLAGTLPAGHSAAAHLRTCAECREEVEAMRFHNQLLQASLAAPALDPQPGFYARVLERIEAQRPVSVWALFADSVVGKYLVTASLALALLTVGAAVSMDAPSEPALYRIAELDPLYPSAGFSHGVLASRVPDQGAVFMSLVSYQER